MKKNIIKIHNKTYVELFNETFDYVFCKDKQQLIYFTFTKAFTFSKNYLTNLKQKTDREIFEEKKLYEHLRKHF